MRRTTNEREKSIEVQALQTRRAQLVAESERASRALLLIDKEIRSIDGELFALAMDARPTVEPRWIESHLPLAYARCAECGEHTNWAYHNGFTQRTRCYPVCVPRSMRVPGVSNELHHIFNSVED